MATANVNATNDASHVYALNADYPTAQGATTGTVSGNLRVGQYYDATPIYGVYRSFLAFAIPSMLDITSCILHLDGQSDNSTTDFNMYIVSSTYTTPVSEDFDLVGTTLWSDAWNSVNYSANDNAITLNSTGLSAVLAAQGGTLRIALRSEKDINATTPTGSERVNFTPNGNAYLTITYTEPVYAPTVTTQAVSDITTTGCTGNGNITNTGGENCTRRGFCYKVGTSGDPTTADSTAYDDGDFEDGAYTKAIAGLTEGYSYRVRAYAVNSGGTGYGSTVDMTTNSVHSFDISAGASVAFGLDRTNSFDIPITAGPGFSNVRIQPAFDISATGAIAGTIDRENEFDITAASSVAFTQDRTQPAFDITSTVSLAAEIVRENEFDISVTASPTFGQDRIQPAFDVSVGAVVTGDIVRENEFDISVGASMTGGIARENEFDVSVTVAPVFGQDRIQPAFDITAGAAVAFGQNRTVGFNIPVTATISSTWVKILSSIRDFLYKSKPSATLKEKPVSTMKKHPQTS